VLPGPATPLPAGIRPLKFESPSLTSFWGRPIDITGYVVLPPSYFTSKRRTYPTVYWTHGFGGTLASTEPVAKEYLGLMASKNMPEMIWVMLNQSFSTGTVEFADSVNNGPWGFALTGELIPRLERMYRMDAKPDGRFLTRPLVRRLGDALAASRVSGHLRRHVVDRARSIGLPQLYRHRHLRDESKRVPQA
jgi:hypothetical protein